MDANNFLKQQKTALEKIKALYGTPEGEFGPTLFIEHHLEEIDKSYWINQFGTDKPEPAKILSALVLASKWSSEDNDVIDTFDFSLPDDVTDYLLSVRFNPEGEITEVSMES